MQITLKNVKYHADMSEETSCFSATLHVNGKAQGMVRNEGRGGSHFYDNPAIVVALNAYAATLPPLVEKDFTLPYDADMLVDEALEKVMAEKDAKKLYTSRICYEQDGAMYSTSVIPKAGNRFQIMLTAWEAQAAQGKRPHALNTLPFDQFLNRYIALTTR